MTERSAYEELRAKYVVPFEAGDGFEGDVDPLAEDESVYYPPTRFPSTATKC